MRNPSAARVCLVVSALVAAGPASAFTGGDEPSELVTESVFGDASAHADSLMFDDGTTNIGLKPGGGTANLTGIPPDAETVRAFVFWSGSVDPMFGVDRDIDLTLPGGTFINDLSVDVPLPGETLSPLNRCTTLTAANVDFYSCRREITFSVAALGAGAQDGNYTVNDVDALPGDCDTDPRCQAMYAAFSVVVFWESPTETVRRELVLYDAFYGVDERNQGGVFENGISPSFNLSGFTVGNDAEVRMTIFSFEGDNELGNPPQDLNPGSITYCPSCPDFVELSGSGGTVRLSGAGNPSGNLFNSTITSQPPTPGVDLDVFDLGPSGLGVMDTGDTSVSMVVGSGDGLPGNGNPAPLFPDQGGSGELVILGYTLLTLDTFAPRLVGNDTRKTVLQATSAPGGTLNYILRVENDGSAAANNVRVLDALPTGVTYVPGSTTNTCGVSSADVGGNSPVLVGAGLNIGTLTIGEECEVRFDVTVNANVADGTVLNNFFTVSADGVDPAQVGPATTTIETPTLGTPTKSVQVFGGGDPLPGANLLYTFRISNTGSQAASAVELTDTFPAELTNVAFVSGPAGAVSVIIGNQLTVQNISVPANSFVEVLVSAQIGAGVAAGTVITNQGSVEGPAIPAQLTDDPSQPGGANPTQITVASSVNLATSVKTVVDTNGAPLIPGDTLEYTIAITQSGSQNLLVQVLDDLPPFVTGCTITNTPPGGLAVCNGGGANGTGRVDAVVPVNGNSTALISFTVQVSGAAPDGSLITNSAVLTPASEPAAAVTVTSPTLEVFARPVFTTSAKSGVDLNGGDLRPGDVIRYTIDVENSGPIGATNTEVTDVVDDDLTVTNIGGGGVLVGNTITWTLGALASGANAQLIFDATVPVGTANGTSIDNVATVTADAPADPFTTDNVHFDVVAEPILSMTKVVTDLNGGPFEPADTVRYTIVVENTGDGAANDIEVRDPIAGDFTSVSFPAGGTQQGNEVVFNSGTHGGLGSLAPGASINLAFDATLTTPMVNGTTVSNQAFATSLEILVPVASDSDPGNGTPDEPTVFTVASQAVLTLTKTFTDDNGGSLLPGERVTFTLELANTGNAPATSVVVTDPLDVRLAFVDSVSGGTAAGQTVTFNSGTTGALATVNPGTPVTLSFRADVSFPLPNGTIILNQASGASPVAATVASDDPTTAAPNDPTQLLVESRPVLEELTKAVTDLDGDGTFSPGDRVRYDMAVTNTGSENAFNLVATDVVPVGLTNVTPGNGGSLAGGTITWTGASTPGFAGLAPGATAVFSFEADIERPIADLTLISNQVSLVADGVAAELSDDPSTAAVDDPTTFEVRSFPSLVVEKRVADQNGGAVEPGDRLAYEIRIRNTGDRAAINLTVDDPLSTDLTNVVAQDGGVVGGGSIQWTSGGNGALASLAIDTEVTLRFEADVVSPLANGTFVDNQATVSVAEAGVPGAPWLSDDPTTAAPGDVTRVQVVSAANLSVSTLESFDEGGAVIATIRPGELIRYVLVVDNDGNAAGDNVVVTLPLPPTLSIESAPGGTIAGNTVTFTSAGVVELASVDPGEQVPLTIEARVAFPLDDGTLIDAQAQLIADGLVNPFVTDDPSTGAASDVTRVVVISEAVLAVEKTFLDIDGAPAEPGDNIQYRLLITNTGDANAANVVVTDPLPGDVTFVSSSSGGLFVGGDVIFNAGTTPTLSALAPDTPLELFFTVVVNGGVANGTQVANQAQTQAAGGPIVLSDDPGTAAVLDPTRFFVETVPGLTITKANTSPAGSVLAPGDPVSYQITILSSGSAPFTGGTFTDVFPAGLANINAPGFNAGTNTSTVVVPSLNPGQTFNVAVTATVGDDVINGTLLSNQAQVDSPQLGIVLSDDPNTPAALDPTVILVEAFPELSASTKVATDENGGSLLPGDVVRYDISVINGGNGQAREVVITDQLDLTNLEVVEVLNGGVLAGNTLLWSENEAPQLSEIAAGATVTVSVRVRVRTSVEDETAISNQASISARDLAPPVLTDNPATGTVDDPTVVTVSAPELTMTKTFVDENGGQLNPGDPVRWDIVITNAGSGAASSVVVTDLIPVRLTQPSAPGATIANGLASWNLGTLNPGSTTTLVLSGVVDPLALGGETLANQAELNAAELQVALVSDDPTTNPSPDATVRTIEGEESYSGTVELFDPDSGLPIVTPVVPEQRVAVRLTVNHTGTQAGQGVVVRIPFLPSQFVLDESPDGVQNPEGTEMRWNASNRPALAAVSPGTQLVFEAVGQVQTPIPDGITINVEGRVSSALSDPELWTIGPASMLVRSRPDLSASTKEVTDLNGGVVEPGDILTYRITAINAGGAEAREVVVVDPAPPGTVYLPDSLELAGIPIADGGSNPLADGFPIGDVGAGRSTVLSFQVRVDTSAVRGLTINNQATLAEIGGHSAVSDNPATPLVIGDATSVVVGGGPLLVASKTASVASAAPGATLTFAIAVDNGGSDLARNIVINDPLLAPGVYVPGTLRIDGTPMTDAADGDEGAFLEAPAPAIEVRRAVLEAGEGLLITFDVLAEQLGTITNQATVTAEGLLPRLTDADGAVPGAQALMVPVVGAGGEQLLLDDNATQLRDANGGVLEAGDPITSTTVIRNRSTGPIRLTAATFDVSALVDVDEAALTELGLVWDANTREIRLAAGVTRLLDAGESTTLQFPLTVSADAPEGEVVRVVASAVITSETTGAALAAEIGSAQLTVGLLEGTSAMTGVVFFESEDRNNVFDVATDGRAQGFQVLAYRANIVGGEPVRSATSDDRGRYELRPLPAGPYRIEVRSPSGAVFSQSTPSAMVDGEVRNSDLRIDPSGIIYRSGTFQPLRGVRVFLYADDGDDDLSNDTLVPAADLPDGQQGQVTGRQGFYRFDPFPGQYRLGVEPTDTLLSFPSTAIQPNRSAGEEHPLGSVATPAADGRVVAHAVPDPARDSTYFLRFNLAEDLPEVLNNHVPLDSLRDALRISKTANRKRLSIGDLVGYTVRIENPSGGEVSLADGGVEIVDALPPGFRLVPDGWRLDRIDTDGAGQQTRSVVPAVRGGGGRSLTFGPFALRPGATYELRYSVVVGPGAQMGAAENIARLRAVQGAVPLTDSAIARVRVVPDPLFDLGSLRAKVFCDENGDGWQDPGDLPLPGARVYLDTGFYADADMSGKLHFTGIPPGMHLAKLDTRTLPPGTVLVGDERENFYISAGLPAQVSFPARCAFDTLNRPTIALNQKAYEIPAPKTPTRVVRVRGELPTQAIVLDDMAVPPVNVDLGVALEGEQVAYGRADGPNVPGIDEEGLLRKRLAFLPRARTDQRVVAWKLTIQGERPTRASMSGSADPAEGAPAPSLDGGVLDAQDGGRLDAMKAQRAAAVLAAGLAAARVEEEQARLDGGSGIGADGGAADDGDTALAATFKPGWKAPAAWEVTPVYVFAGEGALPSRIVWDGKDDTGSTLLQAGNRYGAVLSVVVDGGDEGFSSTRPFGVGWGDPTTEGGAEVPADGEGGSGAAQGFETSVDARQGPLFDKQEMPTERATSWLAALVPQLKEAKGVAEIHVHIDAQPDAAATALTSRQAANVATWLTEQGLPAAKLKPVGEGDGKPMKPNLRERDRKANRRIEIRVVEEEKVWPPVPTFNWPAEVTINGEAVELDDETGAFSAERELPIGAALVVDVRGRGLGRARITRVVELEPFSALAVTAGSEQEQTLLDGDLLEGNVLWGARKVPLDLTGAELVPAVRAKDGRALMTIPDGVADLELQPKTGAEREWVKWTVRIMKPLKQPASDAAAEETSVRPDDTPAIFRRSTLGGRPGASAATPADDSAGDSDGADGGVPDGGAADEVEGKPDPVEEPVRLVTELSGEGAPPESIRWDGMDKSGVFLPSVGEVYKARLIVEALGGDIAISPDLEILVGTDSARAVQSRTLATLADPATSRGALKRSARTQLKKLAKELPADGQIKIEAHDNRGSRLSHRTKSQKVADAVKKELVKAGVAEDRVVALGLGSDQPIVPGVNSRAKTKNRRVVVSLDVPMAGGAEAGPDTPARVLANGKPLSIDGTSFRGEVPASTSGEVALLIRTERGARAVMRLRPETLAMWQGRPEQVDEALASTIAEREAALFNTIFSTDADGGIDGSTSADGDAYPPSATGAAGRRDDADLANPYPDAGVADGGLVGAEADGGAMAGAPVDGGGGDAAGDAERVPLDKPQQREADVDGGVVEGVSPFYVDGAVPYQGAGAAPAWWPKLADVPAARLSVNLPPDGQRVTTDKFVVRGVTDPSNRVLIAGREVQVDPGTGAFEGMVTLTQGRNEIVVEAIDVLGNRGRITRLLQVDKHGWFFLLMAEGAFGMDGARLTERSPTTSLTLPLDTFVYGRGVAYVKGTFEGPYVFRDYDLTLHVDTRRWIDEAFVRDVFDPDMLYPVYGDSSVEVQDAKASYPLYFRLKADHSSIEVGNIRTQLQGGDLFKFQRARYGAMAHFDRGWSSGIGIERKDNKPMLAPQHDPWRTEVKAFVAGGADASRHARVELQGTGSSIYFMRHEDIVEGSERVAIIVRDAITATEIGRKVLLRNQDYTFRYPEGRIVLKEPVPAFADTAFLLNQNLGQVQAGHRVYVEVEYEHNADEPFQAWAAGGQVKQTLFGHAEIGAGYAYEGRYDTPVLDGYHLAGMHAKAWLDEGTFIKGELAWSRSIDAGNFTSYDGGLTYRQLGQGLDDGPARYGNTVFPEQRQGWAAKLEGQASLGELLGRQDRDLLLRGYFQRQSPGFFSGSNIVEQGQWKGGGEGRWVITNDDLVQVRADYVWSEIPEVPNVSDVRNLHRAIATARYQRRLPWGLTAHGELGGGFTYDTAVFGPPDTNTNTNPFYYFTSIGALGLDWQLLEDLQLGFRQEVVFTGDGTFLGAELLGMQGAGRQLQTWNDHFVSHITAKYNLTESLALTGTESVRWNGENQTSVGLSWKVNDTSRVYANERLGFTRQGMTNTTVIGGETSPVTGSRTYAEYQLTSGFAGQQSRGVAGIVNRFKLPFGFALNFGYERVQVLGGNVTPTQSGAVPPGAFTDGTFSAAPGANNGGDYLYGAGSRDAASLGVEYKRGNVLFSQRLELRYDNFDEDRGGRDRIWAMSMTNFNWVITPELAMLARYNVALAYDLNLATRETHLEEGSLGLSYRPITHDWISVWAKLQRRVEVRPISLKDGRLDSYMVHAASVEPIVELPWKFQLVTKGALKHASQAIDDLDPVNAYTFLGIGRLNWHALGTIRSLGLNPYVPGEIDLGVEYRALWGITAGTIEHGFLIEAQYAPLPYFRLGLGWNFTRFSDNVLLRNQQDHGGFFIRAVGQY